ncbi:MAG: 50S ribosomal protein L4 [Candidatus Micrarchaeota archaeon]|nr:50S ribosomal protein L4 [Candidatus Micrarchaeota archaeon]
MKANVYSIDGAVLRETELPQVFEEDVRQELISRAVIHEQSLKYQPKGAFPRAGLQTTAEYRGRKEDYRSIKNHGISRLPREKLPKGKFGKVRRVPLAVSGRRAHPPDPNKTLIEKMNRKEYGKALNSAIAASADISLAKARGHVVDGLKALPLVIEDKFESLKRTKDVLKVFSSLGIDRDVEKSRENAKKRTGVQARRRGGKRTPSSVLVVVSGDVDVARGARNICGVDVAKADKLTASLLAPGTHPGRLTLWTEAALKKLDGKGAVVPRTNPMAQSKPRRANTKQNTRQITGKKSKQK